ncbi:hypothetical protein T4D_12173 [Trichinella pseudospiralis]|uniref:Uncharacterized protein n=1 Tax=Trichinella pseudospiralis TaxID=6337 RepID=A0A0V1F7D1_TRIPS|nr:hypothetical protein T4D_12173 [Trichinella pseudospiralis]
MSKTIIMKPLTLTNIISLNFPSSKWIYVQKRLVLTRSPVWNRGTGVAINQPPFAARHFRSP